MPFPLTLGKDPIPATAGVGLKPQHYHDVLDNSHETDIGWFEVHTENYMGEGGQPHFYLEKIRQEYPLSMHGVGLSLGSAEGVNLEHLAGVKAVIDRYQPQLVSEHISWSISDGTYLNDLLPVPYTEQALRIMCDNIDQVQNVLGRQILVENPSSYLLYKENDWTEIDFINEITKATGCSLLLDVNNVFVSCQNHGWNAREYLSKVKASDVGEIHLAGHSLKQWNGKTIRIDDHGANVSSDVWDLYDYTLSLIGPKPTLIEWDNNIPSLMTLEQEAERANILLDVCRDKKILQGGA